MTFVHFSDLIIKIMDDYQLSKRIFSKKAKLLEHLKKVTKPLLLIIPAISVGKPGLNDQYRDYLDQAARLYKYLCSAQISVDIFLLGAEHRGDGFLHQIGFDYLTKTHHLPQRTFVWNDDNIQKVGLCSVEEAQLTAQFLKECGREYQIITSISQSQLRRYFFHQQGYGIESYYYVFPDNPTYYHLQNHDQEKILIAVTEKDPTWKSDIGLELRRFAHRLRDPNESEISQAEIQAMQKRLAEIVA